ncbi:MAG: hypothetical protein VX899_22360 [Myxococcota bacterium]|nr:hypothetical protein [Myxococcota bacterium]
MANLIDWLMGLGRKGAVLSFGIALAALLGHLVLWRMGIVVFVIPGIALLFGLMGLGIWLKGDSLKVTRMPDRAQVTQAHRDQVQNAQVPFHYCTHCLLFSDIPMCTHCDRTLDTISVHAERDRKLLLAELDR